MKRVLVVSVLLVLLAGVLAGCGGGNEGITYPSTPLPVIERTAEELILELKDNPNKYTRDTVIQVSGTIAPIYKIGTFAVPSIMEDFSMCFVMGPHEGFYVILKCTIKGVSGDKRLKAVQSGDKIVVKGDYDGFRKALLYRDFTGPVLRNCEWVTKY